MGTLRLGILGDEIVPGARAAGLQPVDRAGRSDRTPVTNGRHVCSRARGCDGNRNDLVEFDTPEQRAERFAGTNGFRGLVQHRVDDFRGVQRRVVRDLPQRFEPARAFFRLDERVLEFFDVHRD
jgi:hypothetical protein